MATDTSSDAAAVPEQDAILDALATVNDPEIHRPITELGMVKSVEIGDGGAVAVTVYLTVSGCPMRETITKNVTEAVERVAGVTSVAVTLDVMSDEQRKDLAATLRGGTAEREVPFAKPGSLTRVYAVASGKGGVGKSSVTVNLAAAMAADGLKVGVVDADIYGHSVPRMLGVEGRPTQVENMIMPPSSHGVKVISIGMFTPGNAPVVWRGPMLHRALQQFLADVFWGDLDVLLLDLPPGTGDIAISVAQLVPNAEILVVTTPQQAAAEVAERAGFDRRPDPPEDRRRRREHVGPAVPALRRDGGRLRLGRRPEGRRRADQDGRCERAGAGFDPDRRPAARGRRRRQARGPVRPGLPGGRGPAGDRGQAGRPRARSVGHVAGHHPAQQVLIRSHAKGAAHRAAPFACPGRGRGAAIRTSPGPR